MRQMRRTSVGDTVRLVLAFLGGSPMVGEGFCVTWAVYKEDVVHAW